MSQENSLHLDSLDQEEVSPRRSRWVSGTALILLGVIMLAAQVFQLPSLGQLILPALGVIFLLWGIFTRTSGLLIPGGILSGIGAGVYLMQTLPLSGEAEPGVFLLSFGAGFALIPVLSLLFTRDRHWWAFIPGGILAAIGAALLIGGPALDVLEMVGKFWPVILIAIGAYMIFKRR